MTGPVKVYRGAERPALQFWLRDTAKNLIDFSTGYTFSFKIGYPGQAALLTKTSGIVGAAGSGVDPTGTPNVTVTFSAGELDNVPRGKYEWQITATTGGNDRPFLGPIEVAAVIT
jgi:hypothetical protein